MLFIPLISVALAASPAAGLFNPNARSTAGDLPRKIAERDLSISLFWNANTPTPSATYDGRYADTLDWFEVSSNNGGTELDNNGDKVGYRLHGDDSSAVVYTLSSNNAMINLEFVTDDSDDGPGVDVYGTLATFYPSTTASNSGNESDVWDSTDSIPIVLNKTIIGENVECLSGMVITITTVDANGATLVYTGTDTIEAPIPTALPANVTVVNENNATAVLFYNGLEPVSASFGSGNVPVPQADLLARVQYCPD